MKKIIIAGYGFVGKAVVNSLKSNYNCIVVDPKHTPYSIAQHADADGIIVCVDTPSAENGICDIRNVCNVLDQVPTSMPVLIKSTIIPDSLTEIVDLYKDLTICHSPEFLRAKSADYDFANQTYMIIGGEDENGFWQDLFSPVLSKCRLYFKCSIVEAATIKYTSNSFLATKLAFFNQVYDLCQSNGADYDVIRQVLSHDTRIGNSHMLVPGADGLRGFGGHCFPKDTKAFQRYTHGLNKPISILDSAMEYNDSVRKPLDI